MRGLFFSKLILTATRKKLGINKLLNKILLDCKPWVGRTCPWSSGTDWTEPKKIHIVKHKNVVKHIELKKKNVWSLYPGLWDAHQSSINTFVS